MSDGDLGSVDEDAAARQAVVDRLRPMASSDLVGKTLQREEFNQARDVVIGQLPPEPAQRWLGKQVALGLIAQMQSGAFSFDDMDAVMGIGSSAYRQAGIDSEQVARWEDVSAAAKRLLGDFAQGGGSTLEQWAWTQPMVEALCAFHIIAWHRLAVVGKLPPLSAGQLPSAWT